MGIQKLNTKLDSLSEEARKANQQITANLGSIKGREFQNEEEQNIFFSKISSIIETLSPKESGEFKGWQNQPLNHKLKVVLPLVFFHYEAEMDVSKFSFPKSWEKLKEWFVNQ